MSENRTVASMTGFGRYAGESSAGRLEVEARSLNHRYLEVACKLPRELNWLEPAVRKLVRERFARGKVDVFVGLEASDPERAVDLDRADRIARALAPLAERLGDRVTMDHVLSMMDLGGSRRVEGEDQVESEVLSAVDEALDRLAENRRIEGKKLNRDIVARNRVLRNLHRELEPVAGVAAARSREILLEYLGGLDLKDAVDPQRLEAEIALMAQKADVTEEMTRLGIHLNEMERILGRGGAVGRKLDFLIQEIHREINTIGSKAQIAGVSGVVVDFKSELEKIREQVQNIE